MRPGAPRGDQVLQCRVANVVIRIVERQLDELVEHERRFHRRGNVDQHPANVGIVLFLDQRNERRRRGGILQFVEILFCFVRAILVPASEPAPPELQLVAPIGVGFLDGLGLFQEFDVLLRVVFAAVPQHAAGRHQIFARAPAFGRFLVTEGQMRPIVVRIELQHFGELVAVFDHQLLLAAPIGKLPMGVGCVLDRERTAVVFFLRLSQRHDPQHFVARNRQTSTAVGGDRVVRRRAVARVGDLAVQLAAVLELNQVGRSAYRQPGRNHERQQESGCGTHGNSVF